MNRCSGCGYIVPGAWTACRRCGKPIEAVRVAAPAATMAKLNGLATLPQPMPAPAPVGFGAPDDALLPGARPRGIVPDTMLPSIDQFVVHAPPPAVSRFNAKTIAIGALALAVVAAGIYSVVPHGGHAKQPPTVLAPRPPATGIPTSVSDVVRIAAESARHTALMTVIEAAGIAAVPLSPAQLQADQPNYQWVMGSEESTTNTVISITSGTGIDVIAVSGTDGDICAFGRWSPTIGSDYVTMDHVTDCSANNAPIKGWSSQRGGSAQDLPGIDGV